MTMSREEVAELLYGVGFRGDDLVKMVAIGGRESGYNPAAHRTDTDRSLMVGDFGLFQINYVNDTDELREAIGMTERAQLLEPEMNARAAFYLYEQGGLDPWTAAAGGWTADGDPTYGTDLAAAQAAVARAEALGLIGPTLGESGGLDIVDPGLTPIPPVDTPEAPPPVDPMAVAASNVNSVDTDVDMLPDHYEIKYGLDPNEADTDGDGITDGYELIVLGTEPDLADSDFDGISDGLELSLGLDPTVADNPDPDAVLVAPDDMLLDTDGDGITDWGEEMAGTDADNPDTDGDGALDGDELIHDTDPLSADI